MGGECGWSLKCDLVILHRLPCHILNMHHHKISGGALLKFGIILILTAIWILVVLVDLCHGSHENLCFGLPTGRNVENDSINLDTFWTVGSEFWQEGNGTHREGWRGVGFQPVGRFKKFPGERIYEGVNGTPTIPEWIVTAQAMQLGARVLHGWIRIMVDLDPDPFNLINFTKNHVIDRVAITARGRTRGSRGEEMWISGVGDFVHDVPSCDPEDLEYSPYQIINCGGASAYQPSVGSGMVFVRQWADPSFTPTPASKTQWSEMGPKYPRNSEPTRVFANFRLAQTPCNYIEQINFRVIGVLVEKGVDPTTYQNKDTKYLYTPLTATVAIDLSPKFIGPPDALPRSPEAMRCLPLARGHWNGQIKNVIAKNVLSEAQCYQDFACTTEIETKREKFYSRFMNETHPTAFQHGMFVGRCGNEIYSRKKWPGLLNDTYGCKQCRADGSRQNVHKCLKIQQKDVTPGEWKEFQALEDYDAMLQRMRNESSEECKLCPTIAPRPHTTRPTRKSIGGDLRSELRKYENLSGVGVTDSIYSLELWDSRVVHGVLMTVVTFFVLPVNALLARYYKETYMDVRLMYHRFWFFIHLQAAPAILILFWVGLSRLVLRRNILGQSLEHQASTHRMFGWICVLVTIFLTLFGGCRCIGRTMRFFTIAGHSLLGFGVYVLSLMCFLNSGSISASPASFEIHHESLASWKEGIIKNPTLAVSLFWILFDVIMHLTQTVLMCATDCKLKLSRPRYYFPTPIPVVHEHFRFDLNGSGVRKFLLWLYLLVSCVVTGMICHNLSKAEPRGRNYGPMSCTHSPAPNGKFKWKASFNRDFCTSLHYFKA